MISRLPPILATLVAGTGGLAIAAHYPLLQPAPLIVFTLLAAAAFRWPTAWLVALPALLPISGLAPWSGWISFEETDLLVLATATGGYARWTCASPLQARASRWSAQLLLFATLTALATAIAMVRGFADAGGFSFDWYQGYEGPMNSLRIGKSLVLAILLLPLLNRQLQTGGDEPARKLCMGLAGGLLTASLVTVWERSTFTSLLNFSSDYRTTGPFWEMHVGGAALDGWLLLTTPFAVWLLRCARTPLHWAIALTTLAVGAYGCLTTFSRGVYLALPFAILLLGWLTHRQQSQEKSKRLSGPLLLRHWAYAAALFAAMSMLIFPSSGYRGLLALLGLIAATLPLPAILFRVPRQKVLTLIVAGALWGITLLAAATIIPKGAYIFYAVALASVIFPLALSSLRHISQRAGDYLFLISHIGLQFAATNVAWNWGGSRALIDFLGAIGILAALLLPAIRSNPARWPVGLRPRTTLLALATGVFGVTAIFSGGAYMSNRFASTSSDLAGRLEHWRQTVSMLQGPSDLIFGKGLGRFPANYFFAIPDSVFPGTYSIGEPQGNSYLTLTGSRDPMSDGKILRLSQRIATDARGPFTVHLRVRARTAVRLLMEVCEKHLLYPAGCQRAQIPIPANSEEWQVVQAPLKGAPFAPADWLTLRPKVFSLGVENRSGIADIDDVVLSESGGNAQLVNGDFSMATSRWLPSSDRDHLPWHAKNIFINVFFDQGALGLLLFGALITTSFWRLAVGRARNHPLAPYVAASLAGFLTVGIFDSLLDVPRLAFFFYLLAFSPFCLPDRSRAGPSAATTSAG